MADWKSHQITVRLSGWSNCTRGKWENSYFGGWTVPLKINNLINQTSVIWLVNIQLNKYILQTTHEYISHRKRMKHILTRNKSEAIDVSSVLLCFRSMTGFFPVLVSTRMVVTVTLLCWVGPHKSKCVWTHYSGWRSCVRGTLRPAWARWFLSSGPQCAPSAGGLGSHWLDPVLTVMQPGMLWDKRPHLN